MQPIVIAFCADKTMEAALHVAVRSALTNLDPRYVPHFYLMVEGFSLSDKALFERTLTTTGRDFEVTYLQSTPEIFAFLPSLHGSRSTYYRLSLPDLIPDDRVLYLDSDIMVRCDLSPLFELDMGDSPLGAIVDGKMGSTLDKDLRTSLGHKLEDPAFNAGVLLFNCAAWREQKLLEECLRFGREHGEKIPVVDQSILNCLFASNCVNLPGKFNTKIYNHSGQSSREGVLHYVGSPKPWDLGARFFLPYAEAWFEELSKTALPFNRRSTWLTGQSWKRFPKILGGYRRLIKLKFFK
jgi:lipopolysaccharide biosynthesis glycosyltransferase